MSARRVVVTGMGAVSPFGNDRRVLWEAIREGRSGIGPIEGFDASGYEVRFAGEARSFDPLEYLSKREARRVDRFTQLAVAASTEAIRESGLSDGNHDPRRVGVYIGTGIGGLIEIETQHTRLMEAGPRRISPLMIPKLMTNAAAGMVSIINGFQGPSFSVSSACASGSNAIGEAFDSIRTGRVDVQVCGGAEAAVTPMGVAGFAQAKALSKRNDEPQKASRPFDSDRDGFVMAEGAAVIVLESLEHAKARGAVILAEMAGCGASSDAYHMTLPCADGTGAQQAMERALNDARANREDISYINAHGTSTPAGDDIEAQAVLRVFAGHAPELAVSSSKSMFGHLLGASGAVESVVCIMAIMEDLCPPTINLDNPDPACGKLNFVPHQAQERTVKAAMNNSFGFGGHNVAMIFKKFED